jgi:hypothetical protein
MAPTTSTSKLPPNKIKLGRHSLAASVLRSLTVLSKSFSSLEVISYPRVQGSDADNAVIEDMNDF